MAEMVADVEEALDVVGLRKERVEIVELYANAVERPIVREHWNERSVEMLRQRLAVWRRDHRNDRLGRTRRRRRRWQRRSEHDGENIDEHSLSSRALFVRP